MQIKTILNKENRSLVLAIVSIVYLVMMFIIWNVNISFFQANNSAIYKLSTRIFALALLLNIDRIIQEKRLKTIAIYVLIILLLTFNSWFIVNGARSRSFIYSVIPVFMVYQLTSQLERKRIINYGFHALLGLFFFYNVVGVIGALFRLDQFFFNIPNILIDNYRYSSILTNPNAWGEFAVISLYIATYFLIKNDKLLPRLIYLVLIAFSCLALIASMSRNAILMAMLLYLGILIFIKNFDNFIKKYCIIGLSAAVLGVIALFIINTEFVLKLFRLTQGLTGRNEIWEFMIRHIKDYFWFGMGYGNNALLIFKDGVLTLTSAHNLYLGLIYEMGFLPFVILILYFIKKIVDSFRYIKYTKKYRVDLILTGIFLFSFLVGQFFEYTFFKIGSMNTFIFIIFGLLIEDIRSVKEEGIYKKKITHLITGLDNGGSESMLYKVLKYGDQGKFKFKVISLDTKGFYGDKIEALGIEVVALELKNIKRLPISIYNLIKHIITSDVLQSWLYHANLLGVIVGRILLIDKIIWGVRQADVSYEHNKKSTMKIARISKYFSWLTDYILSCSDETTNAHQQLGYSKKRFVTIYNGFELDLFKYDPSLREEVRRELNINDDEIVFINVARYDIQKDHETMFKALEMFKEHNQKFKLVLCGMGIEESNQELVEKLENANLSENVILLGIRRDVARLLTGADYFLLSSLGEGFPNALGEAMASELIPVVTNVGDCKMIVGKAGEVVKKQDPTSFYQAILKVVNLNDEEKANLRKDARDRIVNTFDIKKITKQYESLY